MMGTKGMFAFIQNLKIVSPAGMKLESGQLVDHSCCSFSEDLSTGPSLCAVELCNAWLSVMMAPFSCFWVSEILLQNRASNPSLAGLSRFYMRNSEQGSAFTRITRPSFLPFDCYVNESVGRRCDLQAPMCLCSGRALPLNSICPT